MFTVSSHAISDTGRRRPENEDSLVARPALGLFAVCDGMGGHAAGEVASRVAAETIESFVQHTDGVDASFTWPYGFRPDLGIDGNRLVSALLLANREIFQRVADNQELRGMATTAVCLLLARPPWPSQEDDGGAPGSEPTWSASAMVAHVGDSRAYLWREGVLEQITRDHSWVEEQIASGALSEGEARSHPWRNLVTRALAGAEPPDVEITPVALERGDRVLICSDGLTTPLTDAAIQDEMNKVPKGHAETICRALVDAANAAGGPDNISVIVLEIA
jgi:PPM family protein phosphatase